MSALTVAGLVLTFAASDAQSLRLTAILSAPAPARLQWGAETRTASAATVHRFDGLPAPRTGPIEYALRVAPDVGPPVTVVRRVAPPLPSEDGQARARIAVLGDGGPGAGPRGRILAQIAQARPDALVALGNPVGWRTFDPSAPARRVAARPTTDRVPVVLVGPAAEAAPEAPRDPIRDDLGLPAHVHHLRLGPTVLLVLDAELGFERGGPQARFIRAVVDRHPDARWRIAVMVDGPFGSGRRGGHRTGVAYAALAAARPIHLTVSAQDRVYERLERDGAVFVVSGASGGATDRRRRALDATRAFASAPSWLTLQLGTDAATLEARGVEAALIDRVAWPRDPTPVPPIAWGRLAGALGLLALGLLSAAAGLLRAGRSPG